MRKNWGSQWFVLKKKRIKCQFTDILKCKCCQSTCWNTLSVNSIWYSKGFSDILKVFHSIRKSDIHAHYFETELKNFLNIFIYIFWIQRNNIKWNNYSPCFRTVLIFLGEYKYNILKVCNPTTLSFLLSD